MKNRNLKSVIYAGMRRIEWRMCTMLFYLFRIFPINKRKVVVTNYFGKGYGDNGKYICNSLIEKSDKLDIVWAVNDLSEKFPKGIRLVKYGSIRSIYESVTAGVWIDNCRKKIYERKRKKQFYIQTWHGDIGPKKVEGDAISDLYKSYVRAAKNDSKMIDLIISGNRWMTEIYKRAFWYSGEIAQCGYPRRDILYKDNSVIKKIFFEKYKINSNKKILLYAPTFRSGKVDLSVYEFNWKKICEALSIKFGGEWVVLIRLHPNISKYSNELAGGKDIMNVTDYPDMQELLSIADVCVSDYSSSIFEFTVTGKIGFVLAKDYSFYRNARGVWFEYDNLFFPFAKSEDELIYQIASFNREKYEHERLKFFEEVIGIYQEGNASDYISKMILQHCE